MSERGPYDSSPTGGIPTSFGERLRAIRLAWGWTQEDLSRTLNIDQTTISAWERDKIKPRGPALAAVAQLLKLPPEALISNDSIDFEFPPSPNLESTGTESPAWVQLSHQSKAPIEMIDLESSVNEPLFETQEAILRLIAASRQGRKVWIVMK